MSTRTRVTIVAGFLGAGKTSVIRQLVANSESAVKTAVLVNEAGAIGLDGDVISDAAGSDVCVREVVGGCICCSAQVVFRQTVVALLRDRPDRLIIEPTGVAAVRSVKAVFSEQGIADHVEVDPLLVVMDPRQWDNERIKNHPLYIEQCEEADVLAISHTDCCDLELLAKFRAAHGHLPQVVSHHGLLDGTWSSVDLSSAKAHKPQGYAPSNSVAGFITEKAEWTAASNLTRSALQACFERLPPPESVLRCKGALMEGNFWHEIQVDHGVAQFTPLAAARQSHLVMIALDDSTARDWWASLLASVGEVSALTN
jgi:G3E family GTPase